MKAEDRPLLQRRREGGHHLHATPSTSTPVPLALQPRGARRAGGGEAEHLDEGSGPHPLAGGGVEADHPGSGEVHIAVVGKYVDLTESYKSLAEALTHGGIANDCRVNLVYLDSEKIEGKGPKSCWRGSTASSFRAASASGGPKGRSRRSSTPARRRFPSSASASACRWRPSNTRATSATSPTPSPASSSPTAPTR